MTDKATIVFRLRHAIDRVANNPGDEWFSGAHEDLMGWIDQDLDAFEARVRAEVAEQTEALESRLACEIVLKEALLAGRDQRVTEASARARTALAAEWAKRCEDAATELDEIGEAAGARQFRTFADICRNPSAGPAGSSPDTTPPLDMGFLSLPPEIQAAAHTTPRIDDCGVCDLVPTVSGYVRGVQVSCPVHGTTPEPCRSVFCSVAPGPHPRQPACPADTTDPPQLKVKLYVHWLPFSVEAEKQPFTDEQRQALAGHEDHQTIGAWSAFGWRELRCKTCDASVWSVTTPEES